MIKQKTFLRIVSTFLAVVIMVGHVPYKAFADSQTVYRYHRYQSDDGTTSSICRYYAEETYHKSFHFEVIELDHPLKVDNGRWRYFQHVHQPGLCEAHHCQYLETYTTDRYADPNGQGFWYREEIIQVEKEPEPEHIEPAPIPAPEPEHIEPAPIPAPEPEHIEPAPIPAPEPEHVEPAPIPAPEPEHTEPAPIPAPEPEHTKPASKPNRITVDHNKDRIVFNSNATVNYNDFWYDVPYNVVKNSADVAEGILKSAENSNKLKVIKFMLSNENVARAIADAVLTGSIETEFLSEQSIKALESVKELPYLEDAMNCLYAAAQDDNELCMEIIFLFVKYTPRVLCALLTNGASEGPARVLLDVYENTVRSFWDFGDELGRFYADMNAEIYIAVFHQQQTFKQWLEQIKSYHAQYTAMAIKSGLSDYCNGNYNSRANVESLERAMQDSIDCLRNDIENNIDKWWYCVFFGKQRKAAKEILRILENVEIDYLKCYDATRSF